MSKRAAARAAKQAQQQERKRLARERFAVMLAALRKYIADSREHFLSARTVHSFLDHFAPGAAPFDVLEGPPCMIIVRSAQPVPAMARGAVERAAAVGMVVYFVRGRPA